MKFRHLVFILLALIALSGCDRFDHSFKPPDKLDFTPIIFAPLEEALVMGDVDEAMSYFSDDFMHNGQSKTDRHTWLEGIFSQDPNPLVEVKMLASQQTSPTHANVNWQLKLSSAERGVLADSTFIGDTLIKENDRWLLKGNGAQCSVPDPKMTVVIEYFTFLGCPNCPPVEAKLHQLQQQHAGQLIYLEHHTTPPLAVTGDPTFAYYGASGVPAAMVQGINRINGSSQESLDAFDHWVHTYLDMNKPIEYKNLLYTQDGQTISGSVELEFLVEGTPLQDLYLNAVLIEKTSSYTNTQQVNLHNVVRGKRCIPLDVNNLNGAVSFSVDSVDAQLPDDTALVIFVQHKPGTFNNDAFIYGGIEVPLNITNF
ncbi:MAG: hypothetical protein GX294_06540 [Candidatus Cloacimonetes bacterium]|nr:hypothetical protein [Candidatus Cloacimonadota bacterium]